MSNQLRDDFMWGSATASYQCEGAWNEDGRVESMWDRYLHDNKMENGDVASDHYHRYKEDIRMLAEGGQNAYRFSLGWPRIITDIDGTVNEKGVKFYEDIIDECLKYGVEPYVTIYHWDLPQYLEDIGGWQNRKTIDAYKYFCEVVMKAYDGKVKYWSTFNEPRWFIFNGYFIGNYPPCLKDAQMMINGSYNVMVANAEAIESFRRLKIKGEIGLVVAYTPIYGIDDSPETKIAVRNADNYCNNWNFDPAIKGEFPPDLVEKLRQGGFDLSFVKDDDLELIKVNTVDFIGLNYYDRHIVKPYTTGGTQLHFNHDGAKAKGSTRAIVKDWFECIHNPHSDYTDWDTEIIPQALYDGLMNLKERYHVPLHVVENGIGVYEDVSVDEVQDDYRIDFMNGHFNAVLNAIDDGADVRCFFVWSTFDLYSWKNGHEKRYGLVAVDYADGLKRKPKKSYYWYRDVIQSKGNKVKREKYSKDQYFI